MRSFRNTFHPTPNPPKRLISDHEHPVSKNSHDNVCGAGNTEIPVLYLVLLCTEIPGTLFIQQYLYQQNHFTGPLSRLFKARFPRTSYLCVLRQQQGHFPLKTRRPQSGRPLIVVAAATKYITNVDQVRLCPLLIMYQVPDAS